MRPDEARRRAREAASLNAFITLTEEDGDGPAVAVKDLIDVKGTVTTGGSDLLPHVAAESDAPVVSAIRNAGCAVVGKTNLHEWALGATSNNRHFGPVRNPHDPKRVAGGSSGGSAAATAAGLCDWAIGTDTGGSIRIPAALCGVAGMRPTVGTVSTEGVIPLSPSLDTVGPLATDVATLADAMEKMAGSRGWTPSGALERDSFRIAVPRGWVVDLDADVDIAWKSVAKDLPQIDFPDRQHLYSVTTTIVMQEAARFHRKFLNEAADRYEPAVLADLQMGLAVTSEAYVGALVAKRRIEREIEDAMVGWDAIVTPTTACVAPTLEEGGGAREPLTRFTRPLSVAGHPVITVPLRREGLPVGIQFFGRYGEDVELLRLAATFERAWGQG